MKLCLIFPTILLSGFVVAGAGCGGSDSSGGGGTSGGGGAKSGGGGTGATSSGGGTGATTSGGGTGNTTSGGGTGNTTSGGGAAGTPAGGGAAGTPATGGTGGGTDPLAECKAQAATQPDPACANCACDNCLSQLQACQADPTCVALRECVIAKKIKCTDQFAVLLQCGPELNAAGGPTGPGATKAIAVRDCTTVANCNCCPT